ncbi:MAG TPA: ABC transporter permease [Armatimonadota bacterium]|nr:ABC transporter permease [Armatimonadota bacterium]
MNLWASVVLAFEAISANRLRSALTMLGIIFGVGAVIAAVSLTEGAKAATLRNFERMGTNTLTIRPGQGPGMGGVRGGMGSRATLTRDDAEAIAAEVKDIVSVAPQVNGQVQVTGGGENTSTTVIGTTEASETAENYQITSGRFITADDVDRGQKVAVVGPTLVKNLFGEGADAVGLRITVGGKTFRVVGQYASKGSMGFRDPDDQVLIPVTTAIRSVLGARQGSASGTQTVNAIVVQVASMDKATQVQAAIKELLRQRHKLREKDEDDFNIMSVADVIQGATEASKTMTALFSSVAAVSLIVGGIGIMNIMLVSVTERTREIGLRKAVGATPGNIQTQFLIEAVTLSLVGGVLGIAAGLVGSFVVKHIGLNAKVSITWIVIAFSFAAAVGVVFGLLPARKAAGLDPVEALRYE